MRPVHEKNSFPATPNITTPLSTGGKYVGENRDHKRHGQGTYTRANGDKYVGEWKNDKTYGRGELIFVSGAKYVGEFGDNNFHDQGTMYAPDGTILQKGYWERGEFVRSEDTDTHTNSVTVEQARIGRFFSGLFLYSSSLTPKTQIWTA